MDDVKKKKSEFWPVFKYVLTLFVISRILLTVIGVFSQSYWTKVSPDWYDWKYTNNKVLDIWSVWDSGWYLDIAENGYSPVLNSDLPKRVCCGQNNLAFFPLYPISMKLLGRVVGSTYFAGILISNISLLFSAYFLYKLVHLDEDEKVSKKAVRYLFLFPVSFVFSAILTESLFLFLAILTFYLARMKRWAAAGAFGFLTSLARPVGFLIIIPLVIEYLQSINFDLKKIRLNIAYFLLIPFGTFVFFGYLTYLTKNPFTFLHLELGGWKYAPENPITYLLRMFSNADGPGLFALYAIGVGCFLLVFIKRVRLSYAIYVLLFFFLPLFSGGEVILNVFRYSSIIFPAYIILSKVTQKDIIDNIVSSYLIAFQAIFMFFWSFGYLGY